MSHASTSARQALGTILHYITYPIILINALIFAILCLLVFEPLDKLYTFIQYKHPWLRQRVINRELVQLTRQLSELPYDQKPQLFSEFWSNDSQEPYYTPIYPFLHKSGQLDHEVQRLKDKLKKQGIIS